MAGGNNGQAYEPSEAASIVFAVLYGLICICTIGQYFHYKCWFWFFAVLASLMEAVGYIAKALYSASIDNTSLLGSSQRSVFITEYVLILIAPAVMAAACYMCMGRIALYATPPKYRTMRILWIVPRWMTLVFVLCDVIAFFIQVLGGVMATSTTSSTVNTGFHVLQIGLAVQIAAFGFFLLISFRFHLVSRTYRTSWPDSRWVTLLWAINVASTLIFIRSIYRLVEFSTGFNGYLNTHEWTFYTFDAAIILIAMATLNVWHPARYLNNTKWKQTDGGWAARQNGMDLDGPNGRVSE